jgi:hypothetical protein
MFPFSFKEYVLVVADDNAVARKLYADKCKELIEILVQN